jgi:hypothetical protein
MGAESVRRLKTAPSVHTRLFDGELVILDLAAGEYLTLDAIGSALWKGLEAGRTVDEVARQVVAEYEVTVEQATADLESLVDDFVARGLFVVDEGPR